MKTEEDEAFDELTKRQGDWGGGFPAKRQMAADKYSDIVSDGGLDPRNKMDAQPVQEPVLHWSDCAVHNGPAYPAGECDCGAAQKTEREALKLALEALTLFKSLSLSMKEIEIAEEAIASIEAALAQPAQDGKCKYCVDGCAACDARAQPAQDVDYWIREATAARQAEMAMRRELEAQPAQEPWANLTEQEWLNLGCSSVEEVRIGLAIQAKLKEKNT
jgi:hypothetical protein